MILLSSSSFFLSDHLTQKIDNNNYNDDQFAFALKSNYIAALEIEEKKSIFGSDSWLRLNRQLAKTQSEAALKLARWYQMKSQTGHQKISQQENALNTSAIMWFEQAIRLHSQHAIIELAQLYFKRSQIVKAQLTIGHFPELLPSNSLFEAVLHLRINIAIYLGDVILIKQLVNSEMVKIPIDEGNSFIADIDKYSIIKNKALLTYYADDNVNQSFELSSSCITSLQLFATNLTHLKHLEQLIKRFKEQQPLAQYICLPIPRYISPKRLDCIAKKKEAISCDEVRWQSIAKEVGSRHIGLMLGEGGANVHLGILYFDEEDSVEVFSHEVSHLLGFIDEYPLIIGHDKCQGIQSKPFSHNIAVLKRYYQGDKQKLRDMILKYVPWAKSIKVNTPILQSIDKRPNKQEKWLLGTPSDYKDKVGVHFSESCQNSSSKASNYSAFKPLSRRTQLRYFAEDFPREYLTLIKEKPSAYLMPSFHYNIALALYQQGNITEAKYWLSKAGLWEKEPVRKAAVLRGDF